MGHTPNRDAVLDFDIFWKSLVGQRRNGDAIVFTRHVLVKYVVEPVNYISRTAKQTTPQL